VKVVGLDVRGNFAAASDHGILGIPALLYFKDGKEVARLVGVVSKARILSEAEKLASA